MKTKYKLVSAFASRLMAVGLVAPAAAAITISAGGGTWSYGITYYKGKQATVYSHYYHGSVFHRASTINGYQEYSCCTAGKGGWARTAQRAHPERADHAYWSKNERCY